MAPKKKEVQKLSLNEFMNDNSFGGGGSNWADEVEETYGTQPLPASDRRGAGGAGAYGSGFGGSSDRYAGYARQEREFPQELPTKPPYTAHLGNLSYDATQESVTDFFAGCEVVSVRIVEDRAEMRPKGFGYAEFATVDGLKKALELEGQSFEGRNIRIRIADPPKDRHGNESTRDFSDWSRKGPLAPEPPRNDRRGPRDFNEPPSPFGAARPIDTAARERMIEEKHQQALKEKKEAEEKAKEERRLAKEAAEKEAAEKEVAEKEAAEKAAAEKESAQATSTNGDAEKSDAPGTADAAQNAAATETEKTENGEDAADTPEKGPARAPAAPSRATDSGNWRQSTGERGNRGGFSGRGERRGGGGPRGGRGFDERQPSRGGRGYEERQPSRGGGRGLEERQPSRRGGEPSTPTTPTVDEDGWTTVSGAAKNRRGRPVAS
ncbi:putative translation initiation factor 4b [Diaporthe ampelina]|uniref:Putative translation initiation factor 4b n=1 Tax=Diaporthe ampelina TaxID=1214573 RepID=A0A0G2IG73_9PEZI|nr:putative translation initiation factor 4b [Diaporthe ampelina]